MQFRKRHKSSTCLIDFWKTDVLVRFFTHSPPEITKKRRILKNRRTLTTIEFCRKTKVRWRTGARTYFRVTEHFGKPENHLIVFCEFTKYTIKHDEMRLEKSDDVCLFANFMEKCVFLEHHIILCSYTAPLFLLLV